MRWWLRHLPYAVEADQLLREQIRSGRVRLYATDSIESSTMAAILGDLASERLTEQIAGRLYDDVRMTFAGLADLRVLQTVRESIVMRPAFLIAAASGIPLADALPTAFAIAFSLPLLFEGDETGARLDHVTAEFPELELLRVADLLDY
jgi:hypothetical protein